MRQGVRGGVAITRRISPASTFHAAALALLMSSAAFAQSASFDASDARPLIERTTAGREATVPCDAFGEHAVTVLIDAGQQLRAESLDRAAVALRLAERAARCQKSEPLLGAALNALSDVVSRRGELDAAMAAATESAEINQRLNDKSGLAQAWNMVGNVHWTRGDMRAALEQYRRALDLWTAAGDRRGRARALNNIANVDKATGNFAEALEYLTQALAIFAELGDRRSASVVTDNIGVVNQTRGDYATALQYGRQSLALNTELGDKDLIAKSYDSIGNAYRGLGAYQLALASFEQALALRAAVDDKPGVMETTHNVGLVHFSQGDFDLAIAAYKRGLRLNEQLHDRSFDAEALRNIGGAAWRLGQPERAAADFRASLAIARREGFRTHEGELLHDLAQVALAAGRTGEASRLLDQSLALRRAIGDEAGITEALTSLASTRLAARQYAAARDLAAEAVDNAIKHDQAELVWRAQTVLGVAYRRLRERDSARRALGAAIDAVEHLSAQTIGGESLRQRFFEDKLSPYHELIALDVEDRASDAALELAERSKARVLARLIAGARGGDDALLSADERRERGRLRDALAAANRQADDEQGKAPPDAARLSALQSARGAAREALAAFDTTLAARHPEVATLRGSVSPLTRSQLGTVVTSRRVAVLEFVVGDRTLFAFAIRNVDGGVAVTSRALAVTSDELARRSARFHDRIGARDFGGDEDARAMYDLLMAPFASAISGADHLIVVPDGPLWNVPFQALRGPHGYAIETMAVSYAPSLTVLREIATLKRPSGPPTLLAVGKTRFGGSAPGTYEDLPEAARQVHLISDAYGAERSTVLLDEDATETRVKAAAPRYSVLHLATHGVLDEASPLYSHLVLTPAREAPDDDGRLEAWEIMRLKLAADIVVLAACDTGRGRIAPGEGVVGTMWALFAAGTRSMVVSQYRVEGGSATALLVEFHRGLAARRGAKADSLRTAALGLLHTRRYAHPYYWAGFILVGDAD